MTLGGSDNPAIIDGVFGFCDLVFCIGSLTTERFILGFDRVALQSLTVFALVKRYSAPSRASPLVELHV